MILEFRRHLEQERGLAPGTVEAYSRAVVGYQRWVAQTGVVESPSTAAAYIAAKLTPRTRVVTASALRHYFAVAHPGEQLHVRVRVGESLPKPVSRGELWFLLRGMEGDLRLQVLLMAFAGLRVSEMCALRGTALSPDGDTLRVTGKGQKERIIPIPATLTAMFRERARRGRQRFLFPGRAGKALSRFTVEHNVAAAARRAGLAGVHPHRLRHFFGTWLYALTHDPFLVARAMGHSNPTTTFGYADLVKVPASVRSMDDLMREVSV